MADGIINGMTLRIDKSGRIVFPKRLRERLALKPDSELEPVEQPGGVLFRPIEQQPSMIKVDGLWILQGAAEPGAKWALAVDEVREERIESILKAS